jgi:F-type H+-transporting ATPase subunit beta
MLESGIIKYGDDFMHSMENGGWDLSKVDLDEMKDSKAAFVFGQMNEPPGARARVALSGLTLLNIIEMVMEKDKVETYFSS